MLTALLLFLSSHHSFTCFAMFVFLVFSVLASLSRSEDDTSYVGKCPQQINPVDNFDINRYVGDGPWYKMYYHGKGNWFRQQQCPECRYSYSASDNNLFIEKYYLNDSHPIWYNKTKQHVITNPGSFQSPQNIRDENPQWWHQVVSKVVQTDYVTYSVIWGCYDVEGKDKHHEFAVINSRQRGSLPPQQYNEAKAYFSQHYPSVEFHSINWSDCRARCPQA